MVKNYKQYTLQARRGIKGEAFFESLIADYTIPHHVSGPKDVGIDYICEWVHGDRPSGVLFAVQVKTFSTSTRRPRYVKIDDQLNKLEIYEIKNSNLKVSNSTLQYWRGLGMPFYLFAIFEDCNDKSMAAFYKRYTQILTTGQDASSIDFYADYYKVSDGSNFLAYAKGQNNSFGFARDLFIDYTRCTYAKGLLSYLNPRAIGLNQFSEEQSIFPKLFEEYKTQIGETYMMLGSYIKKYLAIDKGEKHLVSSPNEVSTQSSSASKDIIKKL